MKEKMAVLVTTRFRGVFFGYTEDPMPKDGVLTLTDARNCIYWSADLKGFLGLAAQGPSASCRVGDAAPSLTLTGVTSVAQVTPEAEARWNSAPWS
jgi:hypothetical protein